MDKTNKSLDELSLEELEELATLKRNERDAITKELRGIVFCIDKHKATESVKEIVSGLSEDQKREMYAQLIGVNTAGSSGISKSGDVK